MQTTFIRAGLNLVQLVRGTIPYNLEQIQFVSKWMLSAFNTGNVKCVGKGWVLQLNNSHNCAQFTNLMAL